MRGRISKLAAAGAIFVFLAVNMTGCGKTEIDVMENIEVRFDGLDGSGTAWIANEYYWEDAAFEAAGFNDSEDISVLGDMMKIEEAVSYELSSDKELSNGDEVTVRAVVDNEAVKKYKFRLNGGEKKFTVDGLREIEKVDLFKDVDVTFEGIAPFVRAGIKNGGSSYPVYVKYSIDKDKGLDAGDTVTVTAEYDEGQMLEKGYVAEEGTKEFAVPDCDRYVTELSAVPADTMDKMKKQIEDKIQADGGGSVKEMDFLGNYFLTLKDGVDSSSHNLLYVVYKVVEDDMENQGETFSYYRYGQFENLILLKDGTCSVDLAMYKVPTGSAFSKNIYSGEIFFRGNYYYCGYEDLDTMFNNCVVSKIEYYEYESNVTEQ